MHVTTALHRAEYRYWTKIADQAITHFRRSGRQAYLNRFRAAVAQLNSLRPLCNW